MSIEHMDDGDAERSELSRHEDTEVRSGSLQEVSLARVAIKSVTRARAWRITMQRLERKDRKAPLVEGAPTHGGVAVFPAAQYSYAAGAALYPGITLPPFRSNRVWPEGIAPYVQISWGQAGGAKLARLLAHWPALGGSVVVHGANVEVFGGMDQRELDPGDPEPDGYPSFIATIAPAWAPGDENELSLTQRIDVGNNDPEGAAPGVAYVPDFAKRVRIARTTQTINQSPIPIVAHFYDDQGTIHDTIYEDENGSGSAQFHLVPAAATMIAVLGPFTVKEPYTLHWRISP